MIYATAETAQDIARLLRSAREPITIVAPRGCGKTTELLKYAEEKYPNGQFAMVCSDQDQQRILIRRHWEIFNRISQSHIVAKRLLGEPLGGIDINPPLMVTPATQHLLRGYGTRVFVDELYLVYSVSSLDQIFARTPFMAAVTS